MNLIKKVGDLGRCCRIRFFCLRNRRESMCFFGGGWGGSVMEMLLLVVGLFKEKHMQRKIVDASSVRLNDMKGKVY